MGELLTAVRRRCPAPRPIGPSACGRILETDDPVCAEHAAADPHRVCGPPAGSGSARPPCGAWPLIGLPFCATHDPQLREERRLARESVVGQLTPWCGRTLAGAKAPVLARVIDGLVISQAVMAEAVLGALRTWDGARWGGSSGELMATGYPSKRPPH
jgi:hypothetical protein